MNREIRAKEVRVIGADGAQLGVMPLPAALNAALNAGLDLVEVAPESTPPVCRLLNYSKWRYEELQHQKEQRRKTASAAVVKEMKYRPKISGGDFATKTRQVSAFLAEGHKVKITVMFRGREASHPSLGIDLLDKIAEATAAVAKVEQRTPSLVGRDLTMLLVPTKKHKVEKHDEERA